MSLIRYYKEQTLRDPIVIVAFGGWNDAADSATTALKFLIEQWMPTKIAEIDSEDFFIFTESRPTVRYIDGTHRSITWPTNQFFVHVDPNMTRDIILLIGVEPQLKWKVFSSLFLEASRRFNVSEVVFLGALLADIPHSMAVPLSGTATNDEIKERLHEMEVHGSRYEGPTGMIGVLHEECRQAQIPAASFWAAVPHYLAASPNLKVMAALLRYLNTYLSLGLDLGDLEANAIRFEEQITALVARDPEASSYVRKLEEQIASRLQEDEEDENDLDVAPSSGPLPSADSLIRGVEELLRKQRENGPFKPFHDDEEENT